MSFDWSEYLTLARELVGVATSPASQEAKICSSISRAYYAAFGNARAFVVLRDGHFFPAGENAHQHLIDYLDNTPNIERQLLGYLLKNLRAIRSLADYQNTVVDLLGKSRAALQQSEEILAIIGRL